MHPSLPVSPCTRLPVSLGDVMPAILQALIITNTTMGLTTTVLELFGLLSHVMWYEVGSHCGKVSFD